MGFRSTNRAATAALQHSLYHCVLSWVLYTLGGTRKCSGRGDCYPEDSKAALSALL